MATFQKEPSNMRKDYSQCWVTFLLGRLLISAYVINLPMLPMNRVIAHPRSLTVIHWLFWKETENELRTFLLFSSMLEWWFQTVHIWRECCWFWFCLQLRNAENSWSPQLKQKKIKFYSTRKENKSYFYWIS